MKSIERLRLMAQTKEPCFAFFYNESIPPEAICASIVHYLENPITVARLRSDHITAAEGIFMVESLARPGGNVTGLTALTRELGGKRLELLKEAVPKPFPCRGSLRSGQSAQFRRGERASPSRRACAKADDSTLGDTSGGRLREGLCCAK